MADTDKIEMLREETKRLQRVVDDYSRLEVDLSLQIEQGTKFHYAIDSSEIHSFLFPYYGRDDNFTFLYKPPFETRMKLLGLLCERLLFEPFEKIITPAIAVEVNGHLDAIFNNWYDLASKKRDEFEETVRAELNSVEKKFGAKLRSVLQSSHLSEKDGELLLHLLEDHGPTLQYLLGAAAMQPAARAKELTLKYRPTTLSNLTGKPEDPDPELYNVFYDLFSSERPGYISNNQNDASTAALIAAANLDQKQEQSHKVLIVSRSTVFAAVFTAAHSKQIFSHLTYDERNFVLDVVRHPRLFVGNMTKYPLKSRTTSVVKKRIAEAKASAKNLVERTHEILARVHDGEIHWTYEDELALKQTQAHFKILRKNWIKSANWALSARVRRSNYANADEEFLQDFISILKRANDKKWLTQEIGKKIEAINNDTQVHLLNIHYYGLTVGSRKETNSELQIGKSGWSNSVTIEFEEPRFPFEFVFYDNYFSRNRLRNNNWMGENALDRFISNSPQMRYEKALAMAVQLGTIMRWQDALPFCDVALSLRPHAGTPRHEAHFLRAICYRKIAENTAGFAPAIRSIDEAIRIMKSKDASFSSREDPRFLREKSACILSWHNWHIWFATDEAEPRITIKHGLKLADKAIEIYEEENNVRGLLQTLRIVVSFFIDIPGGRDLGEAKSYYERMLSCLDRLQLSVGDMSPRMLDAFIYGSVALDAGSKYSFTRHLPTLEKLVASKPLPDRQLALINAHILDIKSKM